MRDRKLLHIPITRLRELVAYDPLTGLLTRKVRRGRYAAGTPMGSIGGRGYRYVVVEGDTHPAHRVAWALHYNIWPEHDIDHRNRCRSDNWIDNLKPANQAINTANSVKESILGLRGVYYYKNSNRYRARITIDGCQIHLGYYRTAVEAAEVYDAAVIKHYGGDFPTNASLGKIP